MVDPSQAAVPVLREFHIEGQCLDVELHDRGHIHTTFISTWQQADGERKFLHQLMNDRVFQDIPRLMHNIECVTQHLHETSEMGGFETLRLVRTRQGASYVNGSHGPWRTYHFIENAESYDLCDSEDRAHEAARAFGLFQARLIDLDTSELHETLPDFFSTPHRLAQFEEALGEDVKDRAREAKKEIAFVLERRPMVHVIENLMRNGRIPTRVVHGDTKLNNVLFDHRTGKARCIVDLDTCMPAYSLYDFGDLVRFTAATSREDETNLSLVGTDMGLYRALVQGYLEGAGSFLTDQEIELMPFVARLVTLTIGLRFLSDFLAGDVYFKTTHAHHNLERARVQLGMVGCMERQEQEMTTARVGG